MLYMIGSGTLGYGWIYLEGREGVYTEEGIISGGVGIIVLGVLV